MGWVDNCEFDAVGRTCVRNGENVGSWGYGVDMAATGTRQSARARARAANQAVIAARRVRDEANMVSLTDYFTAAETIDAARLTMARALAEIRDREGTVTAAATLVGITLGDARKLLALLAIDTDDGPSDEGGQT